MCHAFPFGARWMVRPKAYEGPLGAEVGFEHTERRGWDVNVRESVRPSSLGVHASVRALRTGCLRVCGNQRDVTCDYRIACDDGGARGPRPAAGAGPSCRARVGGVSRCEIIYIVRACRCTRRTGARQSQANIPPHACSLRSDRASWDRRAKRLLASTSTTTNNLGFERRAAAAGGPRRRSHAIRHRLHTRT